MKIRNEQMEAFSQAATRDFEDRMVGHLKEFFPKRYRALGEAKTREVVREGITRAGQYGIVAEQDVCIFTDLMIAFGRRFDETPHLPWATETLNDENIPDPREKTERLRTAAIEHEDQSHGLRGDYRA